MLEKLDESHFFQLEKIDSTWSVLCCPCSASSKKQKCIEAGPKQKALSNLKAHLKTKSHIDNVILFKSSEVRRKEKSLAEERNESIKIDLANVRKNHGSMFEVVQGSTIENIRCVIFNDHIKVRPQRGSFVFNASEHAKKHSNNSFKRKQASLNSYFQSKKPKESDD